MTTVDATTPYRWPYDGRLEAARLALLVCGADDTWARRTPLDASSEANIDRLRTAARSLSLEVHLIAHDSVTSRRPVVGLPETGSPSLEAGDGESIVHAAGVDGFYGSCLDAVLRGARRDQLILVGRGFETTVHSTLRSANDAGYECLTIADACSALDDTCRAAAVSSIEMSGGIFGAVASTDAVLVALHSISGPPPPSPTDPR